MADREIQNEQSETTSTSKFSTKSTTVEVKKQHIDAALDFIVDDLDSQQGDQLQLTCLEDLPPEPTFSSFSLVGEASRLSLPERKGFSIEILKLRLDACIRPNDGDIEIDRYLDVYREICKLLDTLGSVIRAYIGGDIKQKLGIMKKHKAGPNRDYYDTIENMISYEKRNRIHKKNKNENGSRTILQLHRSLHFIAEFLRSLNKINLNQGVGSIGREAYNRTLAHQHAWAYKRIARLALSTLGEKRALVANFHDDNLTSSQLYEITESVVAAASRVHSQCQMIYEKHNCLDLP